MARRLAWVVVAAVVVAVGLWATAPMRSGPDPRPATSTSAPASVARRRALVCPMHPQITSDDPSARCPLCGMRLVPARADATPAPEPEAAPGASDELRAVGFVMRDPGGDVRVVADVAPAQARRLAAGQPARLDVTPGRSFVGEVRRVEPLSAETGAARVWLTFAGPGLTPGLYGDLRIGTGGHGLVAAPEP